MAALKLIVGLGNPGPKHARDRHNVGFRFVERLADLASVQLKTEARCHGRSADGLLCGQRIRLLCPDTWMNASGRAVQAAVAYYKVALPEVLVVYDELDLPPGTTRLKEGGGHGGHNGIRDIVQSLGGRKEFVRLRVGIGHPGAKHKVTPWVLGPPRTDEAIEIERSLDRVVELLPDIVAGNWPAAMKALHTQDA